MIKDTIKKILGNTYYFSSKLFTKKNDLTIFLFHEITDSPSEFQLKHNIYHKTDDFKKIINWIKKNYNIISPKEILSNKGLKALITFDDGYQGSFDNGIPFLNKLNIPSIHFLNYRPILKDEPNIVSTIDFLCNNDENFKNYFSRQKLNNQFCDFYNITPTIFKKYLKEYKIPISKIKDYQGEIVKNQDLINQKNNNLVFFGNHFYDHWNILKLNKHEIEDYYFKNKMYLEKYKNYTDIVSFTHGVPNINFNRANLDQIISYKPHSIFFSGGGTMQYNDLIFDRTFTTYNEIKNKIFYLRIQKKYDLNLFST